MGIAHSTSSGSVPPRIGGTAWDANHSVTGDVDVSSHKLINVSDPASAQDAATKAYVDSRILYPPLKPGSPTDDFNASLSGWTAHNSQGAFSLSNCIPQSVDGSHLSICYANQMGAIYKATTDTDQEWQVGDMRLSGQMTNGYNAMPGIAILDSSGNGVGMVAYNDAHVYLAQILGWNYNTPYGSAGFGHSGAPYDPIWMRLTRVGNVWDGYVSYSGAGWDMHVTGTGTYAITAAYKAIGNFYSIGSAYSGIITADWVHSA